MTVSVIYRPANTETDVLIDIVTKFMKKIKPENKYCYPMGNHNINILNYATHSATADFVDSIYSYRFFPFINQPIRITTNPARIIDTILQTISPMPMLPAKEYLLPISRNIFQYFTSSVAPKYHKVLKYLSLRETFLSAIDNPFTMYQMKLIGTKSSQTRHTWGSTQSARTYIKTFSFSKNWLTEPLRQSIRKKNNYIWGRWK